MMKKLKGHDFAFPTAAPFAAPESHEIDYDTLVGTKAWGVYRAKDYNADERKILEARRNGRDAEVSGLITPSITTGDGNGADSRFDIISGNERSEVLWPAGSIPRNDRSFCALTRYSGAQKERILGTSHWHYNFLLGHHGGRRGVVYDELWVTSTNP